MKKSSGHWNMKNGFQYTVEERKQYMKELSIIYYRCFMGKATEQELKIAEKFSPSLIEKLKKEYPIEEMLQSEAEKEKEEKEMNEMWKKITGQLNLNCPLPAPEQQPFTEADYQKAYEVELQGRKRKTLMRTLYRYTAAAAMIALTVGTTYFFNNKADRLNADVQLAENAIVSYSTDTTQQSRELLADGTRIELNRESSLEVSREFGKRLREVTMKGQVFFDVAKDASKPFVINASGINVTVRGTSFEVVSYEDIPEREVMVSTGRVEIRKEEDGQLLTTLTKGMQMIYNPETNENEVKTVDAETLTAWRKGKLVLHDASLAELRLRIRQHFGKVLVIENDALAEDIRITSSFNTAEVTVDNVMLRVCTLFGVQSRIDGSRIIISRPMNDI